MKKDNVIKLVASAFFGLVAYACMCANPSRPESADEDVDEALEVFPKPHRTHTFGEAVVAVSNCNMCSLDKMYAIDDIIPGRDSDYYEGIIGIANGTMHSIDKMYAIQNLTNYELGKENK